MVSVPLKWHGGKAYLARRIVALMPPHIHYVEPFAGGLSVLLAKSPEGVSEVVNDLNGRLTNFWRCLQDPAAFARILRRLEAIPLSRPEWRSAEMHLDAGEPWERATCFFVYCRQSLAGRMKGFTALTRTRTRRGMNGNVSEWLGAVDGLPAVHARLRRVVVENDDALKFIPREDGPQALFYCDPPYLHETRATTGEYAHEMTAQQHHALLLRLLACRGKVMVSGYRSEMYDDLLRGWARHDFDLPNNAAGGKEKRRMTECLWCNFDCAGDGVTMEEVLNDR